jgi:hypothetical protein
MNMRGVMWLGNLEMRRRKEESGKGLKEEE